MPVSYDADDAVAEFNERVSQKMKRGLSRSAAVGAVVRNDRELHRRYLAACNPGCPAVDRKRTSDGE